MHMRSLAASILLTLLAACAGHPPAWEADQRVFDETSAKAHAGDVVAERELGEMYIRGRGVKADSIEGDKWLSMAADGGDVAAQIALAKAYQIGTGVPTDLVKAQQLFLKAAQQGDMAGESAAGYGYLKGIGTPVDYPQAQAWLEKAAKAGDLSAATNLGYMYLQGLGVQKDEVAAIGWYTQAAQLGSRPAQLLLADAFHYGRYGVTQDELMSKRYYGDAAGGILRSYSELAEVMKEIIDSHKVYPKAAVDAKQTGNVMVEFDCPGRKPTHVMVTQSSGVPLLDAAAVLAVSASYFPERDSSLDAATHFKIGVDFMLVGPDPPAVSTSATP